MLNQSLRCWLLVTSHSLLSDAFRRLAAAILMKNQVLACQLGTATLRYISNKGGNNDINETNNQVKSQDSPSAMGCCNP